MFTGKEMGELINFAINAHQEFARKPSKTVRLWDKETPYSVHSIWCAMTFLHETELSEATRVIGSKALILHDVLEDTTLPLPTNIEPEVIKLVEEVTFGSQEEAMEKIWEKSDEARLITLYDMVSNILDGFWMDKGQRQFYLDYTLKLKDSVKIKFGNLNIVKIAEAL